MPKSNIQQKIDARTAKYQKVVLIIVWVVALVSTFAILKSHQIPKGYNKAEYTLTNTQLHVGVKNNYYIASGNYTVNGKSYPMTFNESNNSNGPGYIYYNPSNPSQYRIKSDTNIWLSLTPLYAAIFISVVALLSRNNKRR